MTTAEQNNNMARGVRQANQGPPVITRNNKEKYYKPEKPSQYQEQLRQVELIKQEVILDDGRVISLRQCPGQGTPLVYLHGLLDSSASFGPLANSTERPVIAIDLPGFGHSDAPPHTRLKDYADDVSQVLDKLSKDNGCDRYHIVGHSLGGAVASSLADRHSNQVASLTLLTPAGYGSLPTADLFALPILRNIAPGAVGWSSGHQSLLSFIYKTTVSHHGKPDKDLIDRLSESVKRGAHGLNPALQTLHASGHSKGAFFKRQVNYQGPVYALFGQEDSLIPLSHIKGLKVGLPQSQVTVWADMGHHPQYEELEATAAFINKVTAESEELKEDK